MSQTKAQLISDLVQALNFTGTSSAPANGMYLSDTNTIKLATNSNPRLTIDSSGNASFAEDLYVGTSTALFGQDKKVQIASTGADAAVFLARFSETNGVASYIHFAKSSNGTLGQNGKVADGELLGRIYFSGDVGNGLQSAALIESYVDGSVTTNGSGLPGELIFKTAADASSAATTALTLAANKTATFAGTVKIPTVAGTNTDAALNVLFQTGTGVIDGGSSLTFNPANDVLTVNGADISAQSFRGSGDSVTLACDNTSSTEYVKVTDKVELAAAGAVRLATTATGVTITSPSHDGGLLLTPGNNNQETRLDIQGKASNGTLHAWSIGASRSADRFYISDTSNTALAILDGGNVGISVVDPANKLHVIGTTRINQSATVGHAPNAATMLEVRGNSIADGVVDYDYFKGFKIALNDQTEWGGQAQFAVGRWQEDGNNARSSLMISLGHGKQNSSSDADADILLLTSDGQVRIEDGNLKIGTAGHGIDFSTQTGTSATGATTGDEVLDHYEEGTWTPANQYLTITNNNTATYTRIGRVVTIQFDCTYAASPADTSQVGGRIEGLPFAGQANGYHFTPTWLNAAGDDVGDNGEYNFLSYVNGSDSKIIFYSIGNNCEAIRAQTAGKRVRGTVTYHV